jgi:hypothetical protein
MAAALLPDVVSNWSKLIDNFETSALDFYERVQEALSARRIPGLAFSRREYVEGGELTAKRIYLSVSRDRLRFDICAAPFGRGFFFSWWLTEKKTPLWLLLLTWAFMLAGALGCSQLFLHTELSGRPLIPWSALRLPLSLLGGLLTSLVCSTVLAQLQMQNFEDALLRIPVIGSLYTVFLYQTTFYRLDTVAMYRAAVHSAVLETIESITEAKGLRVLTPDDQKPLLAELVAS